MEELGKVDTHLHTCYSGFQRLGPMRFPESVCSPERQVDLARRRGFDVLCITDHNEVAGGFIAEKYARKFGDIDVVVGDEVMTNQGEVIGLWLSEKLPRFLSPEEAVDRIHEQGGLAIAPHPFSMHVDGMQEKMFDLPIEGFETINGGHPDRYANWFAQQVMERHPGRWAAVSGSDAHSVYTSGYNWTEFPGNSAEDFRRAILDRTTVPVGVPAPVLGQVQWSIDVVIGGQKLMWRSLRHRLEPVPDNHLVNTVCEISDVKKIAGIFGGMAYAFPPLTILATLLSVGYLGIRNRKLRRAAAERLGNIDRIIAGREDGRRGARRGVRRRRERPRGVPRGAHGRHRLRYGAGVPRVQEVVLLLPREGDVDRTRGGAPVRWKGGGDHGRRRVPPAVRG